MPLHTLHGPVAAACLALLAGCAGAPRGPIWQPLDDPALQQYAQALVCRIVADCGHYPVLLVDMPQPQAEALPDGRIALRKGLLLAIEEEAELVFVLAHEIAHRQLGHRAPRSLEARLPLELEADAMALAALRRLGHPDDAGARLIARIRPTSIDSDRHRIALQQIEVRVAALPPDSGRAAIGEPALDALLAGYRRR